MKALQFILSVAILVAMGQLGVAQQPVFQPPVFQQPSAPVYLQAPPVIQPAPQIAPVYAPQSTVVPLPSQTPGSIFGPPAAGAAPPNGLVPLPSSPGEELPAPPGAAPIIVGPGAPGIPMVPGAPVPMPAPIPAPPSTITVPVMDDDVAWDQISDVVSDYFRISREQRARRGADGWTEGRIETVPQDGATLFEPHRKDSVGRFNLLESTFQSIRRRASVRVVPEANGYLVEVVVEKELEDLRRPEKSTAGAATFRYDQSMPTQRMEEVSRTRQSIRWIPLGRDAALEQLILADIHARLNGLTSNQSSIFGQ